MFRFTIRDVLWLTVVVTLACALAVTRAQFRSLRSEIDQQWARTLDAGGQITMLIEGWKKDLPHRLTIEDGSWVTIYDD